MAAAGVGRTLGQVPDFITKYPSKPAQKRMFILDTQSGS